MILILECSDSPTLQRVAEVVGLTVTKINLCDTVSSRSLAQTRADAVEPAPEMAAAVRKAEMAALNGGERRQVGS